MDAIIVILPLIITAFIGLLFKDRGQAVKYLALGGALLSSLLIASLFFAGGNGAVQSYSWFNAGTLSFMISISTLPLNMLLLLILAIITPLIFIYSIGFMELPSEQPRFYFEMSIFAAAMMLFAMSANFITMFIAWELLGITSYLLIGFWYRKEKAPTAARKAITTIIIGDIMMLAGILIIGVTYNSFEFSTILNAATVPYQLYAALVLILLAAFTKSAQFPFHEWLSDAMEGPAPVSAFLHSSTMVKAGVFLVAVLLPIYAKAGLLPMILVIGLASALLGASNALTERHIKKILAYSTIEDMGLMFVALGLGSVLAAMMLFLVQAFYKALLFMSAGSAMKANDEREDIYEIYGLSSSRLILITTAIGAVSLAGIFPLSGFFGKAMVEASVTSIAVYAIVVVIELATSVYIFRWLFLQARGAYQHSDVGIRFRSTPKSMTLAAAALAVLVALGSLAYLYLPQYLGSGSAQPSVQIGALEYASVNIIAVIGMFIAFRLYRQGYRLHIASTNRMLYTALYNSLIVNRAYLYITNGVSAIAGAIGNFDINLDKATYAASDFTIASGDSIRRIVSGQTNVYVFAFIAGIVLLLFAFVIYL